METLDLKKAMKPFLSPSARQPQILEIPEFKFLCIDGAIEPGSGPGTSPGFQAAMQALYGIAFTLKFSFKQRPGGGLDYPVMPLEGLWWVDDGRFDIRQPGNWKYRLMILQPPQVGPDDLQAAAEKVIKKKPAPEVGRVSLESFEEGGCVQLLHVGPYSTEPDSVARMETFARENGYRLTGLHHEIYLGNPLRADPEKLRTILRHPVGTIRQGE